MQVSSSVSKYVLIDMEFNGISEHTLNLVSVAAKAVMIVDGKVTPMKERTLWLYRHPQNREAARRYFKSLIDEGYTFVAYVMEAEARGLLALFGDDKSWLKDFKAIDIYLEYRCILNNNHRYAYGKQLINGQVINTTPPPNKWERLEKENWGGEEDDDPHHKPSYSLAAATFKLLGKTVDTAEKNAVRDIIIEGNPEKLMAEQERILKYNESDIDYLLPLLSRCMNIFHKGGIGKEAWVRGALSRGEYAVATAQMISLGYPVNHEKLNKFRSNIDAILKESIEDCLAADPEIKPFRFDKKKGTYICNVKTIRDWVTKEVDSGRVSKWRLTDKKQLSISKDAFGDWFDSQSEGFPGAYCRHLKTKQSLNGFLPVTPGAKRKGNFNDFVGTDGRVRPNFGIYGSQTSRSQPGSIGFIPLKAHWMRNFIEAPSGQALATVDYGSQEFLIAACISQDYQMMDAYSSGDVYLAFGKSASLIPSEGTKASHKKERDLCKALVLGISYDMSAMGLAPRLSRLLKIDITVDYAQSLIDLFFNVYSTYASWKKDIIDDYGGVENVINEDGSTFTRIYDGEGRLELPDGWVMWGDNDNKKSVGNFMLQGLGAVIMREAVKMCQSAGLDVAYTLHDSLTIQFPSNKPKYVEVLIHRMGLAFEAVMGQYGKTVPIKLEGEAWSRDYKYGAPKFPENIQTLTEMIDDKGRLDYSRYAKFFT